MNSERTIRTTRSTIEHRLGELKDMAKRFQRVDTEAEVCLYVAELI